MDQSSLASVHDAVKSILSEVDKINILVNNAGIMGVPERQLSKDCYELQFATNHLSHFLLFQLLKHALLAASSTEFQSRVIVVASDAHRDFGLNETGNYSFENGDYHPWSAYAQPKRANIHFANELDRRYGSRGLHAWSVHPGVIATGLGRFMNEQQLEGLLQDQEIAKYWKSVEQGAATTIWAAVGREHEGKGGRYLAHCADAPLGAKDRGGYTRVEYTYNLESESRLWKDSLVMVGLKDEK